MNNQVLIDRDLLERVAQWAALPVMSSAGVIDELRAILQSPAPEGGEPTVVAFLMKNDCCEPYANTHRDHADVTEPLMTIAQHRAIVAGLAGDGWIACSERLPEENQKIICSGFIFNDPKNGRFVDVSIFFGGRFYAVGNGDDDEECANIDITLHPPSHWQPLPPSPAAKAVQS